MEFAPTIAQAQIPSATRGNNLRLAVTFAEYDRTRALIDGRVKAKGIDLDITTGWIGTFCTRPIYEEYDVAEMSMSWYLAARARGEPVVALPIFPLRMPVQAYMFCRSDSPYQSPRDLVGKRVGTMGYRYTVNLWLRGILQDQYGVRPEQYHWLTTEVEGAGYKIPAGVDYSVQPGRSPDDMLFSGDAEAIFGPEIPESFLRGDPRIRRLFPDARGELARYAKSTGFVPITHTVVVGERLIQAQPWIVRSLIDAFLESQRIADDWAYADPKNLGFTNAIFMLEEERAMFGAGWKHGVAHNHAALDTFIRYAHEQGYIAQRQAVEQFCPIDVPGMK